MRSASASARWSAHRITFRSPICPSCSPFVTTTGSPFASVTASEHVASNDRPFTASGATFASFKHVLIAVEIDSQMLFVDCSKMR